MILCYETPPPPWVWWKRFQQETAEMFGAGRRGASSKWLKRTPASCCSRPRNLDKRLWGSLLNLLHKPGLPFKRFLSVLSCLPAQQFSSVFIRSPCSFSRKLLQPHQPPPQHLQPLPLIWTWKWVEGSLQVLERFFPPWVSLQTRQVLLQSTPDPVATFGTIPKKQKSGEIV